MDVNTVVADVIVSLVGLAMTAAFGVAMQWVSKHTSAKNLAIAQSVAQSAVQAMEQIYPYRDT